MTAANVPDVNQAVALIAGLPQVQGHRGRPRQKPQRLVADKGYDAQALRQLLRWLGITPEIARRGTSDTGLGCVRWPIERTLSWLHQFRRLKVRYDRRDDLHQAFLDLAMSIICFRKWNNRFC